MRKDKWGIDENKSSWVTYDAIGGDEIGMAAMNVYGQPPHAQHVYLPSYYQGQMTYTRKLSLSLCLVHFFFFYFFFSLIFSHVSHYCHVYFLLSFFDFRIPCMCVSFIISIPLVYITCMSPAKFFIFVHGEMETHEKFNLT